MSALDPVDITIQTYNGERIVSAHGHSGLAIHRCYPDESLWTITHVRTGTNLGKANCYFASEDAARSAFAEIVALCDWHRDGAAIAALKLKPAILKIALSHGGRDNFGLAA